MLKRKILAAVLPVVAAGTVVGSGFSAWYFNSIGVYSSSTPVSTTITDMASNGKGEFKVYYNSASSSGVGTELAEGETLRLTLDQGTGNDRVTALDKGISFSTSKGTKVSDITLRYIIPIDDYNSLFNAGLKLDAKLTITLDGTLANYVEIKSITGDSENELKGDYGWATQNVPFTSTDDGLTFVSTASDISLSDLTGSGSEVTDKYYDFKIILTTDENQSNTFLRYKKYKEDAQTNPGTTLYSGKPKNSDAYGAMRTALGTLTNGITFGYTITTDEVVE